MLYTSGISHLHTVPGFAGCLHTICIIEYIQTRTQTVANELQQQISLLEFLAWDYRRIGASTQRISEIEAQLQALRSSRSQFNTNHLETQPLDTRSN